MKNKIILAVVAVAVVAGLIWLVKTPGKPGRLDAFAQCIKESGAKYYGAFWCPNCKNQEALFGRSAKLLPRIECSTPDGKGQLPICQEAGIQGYPTWEFPNGEKLTGTQSLDMLAQFTGCTLPQE
jgi:hypothetical protein